MPFEFKYDPTRETHVAEDDEGITVDLEDDEMDALRVFALREHLSDFDSKMDLDDTTITVGAYRKASGIGPNEARAKVAWVRECLGKIRTLQGASTENLNLANASIDVLAKVGYEVLTEALKRDCPDEVAKGTHNLVNLIYFLLKGSWDSEPQKNYVATIREAWEGGEVKDRREWYPADRGQYLVLTDDEADDAWDEELERYIDDCLEIPESVKPYFDREQWKVDARGDGRGHALSSYDGCENRVEFNGLDDMTAVFYIYRTN